VKAGCKTIYSYSSSYPRSGRGANRSQEGNPDILRAIDTLQLLQGGSHVVPSGVFRVSSRKRIRSGGIITRCPNHLSWLVLRQRGSGSTLRSFWMVELLALSLKPSPATLISATCICDLIRSVTTQMSWPVNWKLCLSAQLPLYHNGPM